jgi:hypothetical protein
LEFAELVLDFLGEKTGLLEGVNGKYLSGMVGLLLSDGEDKLTFRHLGNNIYFVKRSVHVLSERYLSNLFSNGVSLLQKKHQTEISIPATARTWSR